MEVKERTLDKFTVAYLECALWAEQDERTADPSSGCGKSFESCGYGIEDFSEKALDVAIEQCNDFRKIAGEILCGDNCLSSYDWEEHAGHDFFLTRNKHGCGFWDGCWEREAGEKLSELSRPYGETYLYFDEESECIEWGNC